MIDRRARRGSPPRVRAFALVALLLAACVAPLAAQQASAATAPTGEQTPVGVTTAGDAAAEAGAVRVPGVSGWDYLRMVLVLAAVVGAIYLIFALLRRSSRRAAVENDLITVLGSKSLAPNRSLHLVRVGKSVYLVGAAEGGVGLVSEITDKEAVDMIGLQAERQKTPTRRAFSEILSGVLGGGGQLTLPDGLGFVRRQKERVRKLRSV